MWKGASCRKRIPAGAARLGAGAVACLLLAGCASAARLTEASEERDRLARENARLRRLAAEQQVRIEELIEALGIAPAAGGPAPAAPPPPPPAWEVAAEASPLAPGLAPVLDEDVRDVRPPGAGEDAGDEGTLRVARWYAGRGRTSEALDAYTRLIEEHPFSPLLPQAFLERGRLRLRGGDLAGALADFDTVSEAFPGSPLAAEARREGEAVRRR
jgi:tetratricopeptide (TPR) repeat protein